MVKRKAPEEPHEEHADETWLIPYSDLLTLLLALFIVLFASSTLDKTKMEQIGYSFSAAFNPLNDMNMSGSVREFLTDMEDLHLGDDVGLGSNEKGAVIEIANINLFENGTANIKAEADEKLQKIAQLLKENKYRRYRIVVKGHTDDKPINYGNYASNWELSAARAAVVTKRMVALGLDENRFQAIGMAGIAPKVPNYDAYGQPIPKNRQLNNRLEIDIEI